MKTYINKISPRVNSESKHMNVTVIFADDGDLPLRSAEIVVYVDKSITDISEINKNATDQALQFLSEIVAAHRP